MQRRLLLGGHVLLRQILHRMYSLLRYLRLHELPVRLLPRAVRHSALLAAATQPDRCPRRRPSSPAAIWGVLYWVRWGYCGLSGTGVSWPAPLAVSAE